MNDRLLGAVLVGLAAAAVGYVIRRGVDKILPPRPDDDSSSSEGSWSTPSDNSDSGSDSGDSGGGDSGGD